MKIATGAYLEDVLDMISAFFFLIKIFRNIFTNVFDKNFLIFSFVKIKKKRDSSFVAPSILRHVLPKKWS